MAKLNKPNNFTTLWAENGSRSDISGKQTIGWEVEIPDREVMNGLQYRQDYAIAYLLQSGVPEYDSNSIYYKTNQVNVDGVLYKCLEQCQGIHPTTGNNASRYWEKTAPTYGEFQAVLNRINSANPFPQYITVVSPRTAEAIATLGIKSSVDDTKTLTFTDGTLQYSGAGAVRYQFSNSAMATTDSTKNIATTEWVQAVISELRASLEVAVGESIITTNPNNPATYKGYGTWVLDCQGQAIVGVSSNASASDWMKVVDNVYGEERVTLTEANLPAHDHTSDSRFNKLVAIASDVYADTAVRQATSAQEDFGAMDTQLGIATITETAKLLMKIKSVGSDTSHNNVQPSQTKYVYTRTS